MAKGGIYYREKGNFKPLISDLEKLKEKFHLGVLDKYGKKGVELLQAVTPIETGKTAASWYYEIEQTKDAAILRFNNKNIIEGQNIALIIQMGHATQSGYWVEGRDYITPVIEPLFDELCQEVWEEVTNNGKRGGRKSR